MADNAKKNEESSSWVHKGFHLVKDYAAEAWFVWDWFTKTNPTQSPTDRLKNSFGGTVQSREGGEHTLDDERFMADYIDSMDEQYRDFFAGWYVHEFSTKSRNFKKREQAKDAAEEYRKFVCGMDENPSHIGKETTVTEKGRKGRDGYTRTEKTVDVFKKADDKALPYLNRCGKRIRELFEEELQKLGSNPTDDMKQDCLKKAFELYSDYNRGLHRPHKPKFSEPHWTDSLLKLKKDAPTHIRNAEAFLSGMERDAYAQRPTKGLSGFVRKYLS